MSRRKMMVEAWSTTALLAAGTSAQSGWIDIGKRALDLEVTRTSTGGTYVFEADWSRDGGSTTLTTDTIATTAGQPSVVASRARWVRLRVRNTNATTAFTAHSTVVTRDASTGR